MDKNFNTFSSPANTNNGEPVLPAESEPKLQADEAISEQVGPTSDENGYGTDSRGFSRERGDLGAADYNEQVGRRVSDLYAAAEKAQEAEEKAAFPGWYDDEPSTPQSETDPTDPTPPEGSPAILETAPDIDTVKALQEVISAKKEADDRFYDAIINMAARSATANTPTTQNQAEPATPTPAPEAQATNTPPATLDTSQEAPASTATNETSSTESEPRTLSSTEVRNDMPPVTSMANTAPRAEKPTQQSFLGKNGVIYSTREDAINSFKD